MNLGGTRLAALGHFRVKTFPLQNELRSHILRAIEIAFDHENRDIIIKTSLAAETRGVAEDVRHEAFCGP